MSRQKLKQDHCYFKLSLKTKSDGEPHDTPVQLKALIIHSLKTLHGNVGASIAVDVLRFSTNEPNEDGFTLTSAIIRVPNRDQVKVWSSLTLCTSHATVCSVDKVSTSLLSLAVNSRQFTFPQ